MHLRSHTPALAVNNDSLQLARIGVDISASYAVAILSIRLLFRLQQSSHAVVSYCFALGAVPGGLFIHALVANVEPVVASFQTTVP